LGRLKERDHSEDLHVDGVGIKKDHREWGLEIYIGFIWLQVQTGGGLL
jgi:hypothetical protein